MGRFTSQDPAFLAVGDDQQLKQTTGLNLKAYLANPQGLNSYSYSFNNPLIYRDSDGNFAFLIPAAVYIAAYAPVWVPAAITWSAAATAAITAPLVGGAAYSYYKGDAQTGDAMINGAMTVYGVEAGAAGVAMSATGTLMPKVENQYSKNNTIKISPAELKPTEIPGVDKVEQFERKISQRGYYSSRPIRYYEYNSQKYITDGHHRQAAAKNLGVDVYAKSVSESYFQNRWGKTSADFINKIKEIYKK